MIVLNTDWTYNTDKFCTSLALNFLFDLIQQTRDFVEIRVGVSYGRIYYGQIGNTLSFFGYPMNIASRLEHKCDVNTIAICKDFYTKLMSEQINIQH